MSEWLLLNAKISNLSALSRREQVTFGDYNVSFLLDQHSNVISLTQQSADRHVYPLGHIILILRQPVFHAACLAEKQQIPIVSCLTRLGHEPTIYRTWSVHAVADFPIGSIVWSLGPQHLAGLRQRCILVLTIGLSHLCSHNILYFLSNPSVIFLTQLHSISE